MKTSSIFKPIALATSIAILSACGGGGGDDGGTTSSSINGVINKGIIINGIVRAYTIENGQISTTAIAEGTTDETGGYSLSITGYTGPLHIVVSAGPNSTMKCDAASGCSNGTYQFGDTMPMPSTMQMEAVLPDVSGGSIEGHVTPLTHMAAGLAKSTFLDETSIETAVAKIEEIFDIPDLLNADPVDITDPSSVTAAAEGAESSSLKVSFIAGAIAELAETDGGGDIIGTLDLLATTFAENNGELTYNTANDSGGANDATIITLGEITSGTLNAITNYETANSTDLNDSLVETEMGSLDGYANHLDQQDQNTQTTIDVGNAALTAAIASAKDTVAILRTWSTQLTKLDEAGNLFEMEIDTAKLSSQMAMDATRLGMEYASIAAAEAYWKSTQATGLNANLAGKTISMIDNFQENISISFNCDNEYSLTTIDGTDTGEYTAVSNVVYAYSYQNPESFNATFPTSSPTAGDVINHISQNDLGTETGTATITGITEDLTCDLTPSTALNDYVANVEEPWMSATGTVSVTGNNVVVNGVISSSSTMSDNTVAINYTFPALSGSSFTFNMDGTVTNNNKAKLTVANGSSATITLSNAFTLPDEVNDPDLPTNISFNLDVKIEQLNLTDNGSSITDPVSFQGTLGVAAVKSAGTTLNDMNFNPSSLTMSGIFSQGSTRFTASFNATMANAATFAPNDITGSINNTLGSYTFSNSNNTLTIIFPDESVNYTFTNGMITVTWYDDQGNAGSSYSWNTGAYWDEQTQQQIPYSSLTEYLAHSGQWMYGYTWVDGVGEYAYTLSNSLSLSGGSISGTLITQEIDGETSSNWRQLTATLSFEATSLTWVDPLDPNNTEALPDATVTIALNRTGYMVGTADIEITYGNIEIDVTASGNGETEEISGNITITDVSIPETPVKLVITPNTEADSFQGSVSVGGVVVGSVHEDSNTGLLIINYADGSFESVAI